MDHLSFSVDLDMGATADELLSGNWKSCELTYMPGLWLFCDTWNVSGYLWVLKPSLIYGKFNFLCQYHYDLVKTISTNWWNWVHVMKKSHIESRGRQRLPGQPLCPIKCTPAQRPRCASSCSHPSLGFHSPKLNIHALCNSRHQAKFVQSLWKMN